MSKPRYIAHTSGKQPVMGRVTVEVLLSGDVSFENKGRASQYTWDKTVSQRAQIIAYRVIKE